MYTVPFFALTVHVESFSALIVPINPRPWPILPGAAAVGGAVAVGDAVVFEVVLELLDPPEHAATPIASEALITPIATFFPIPARSRLAALVIGLSSLIRYTTLCRSKAVLSVMGWPGASKLQTTSQLAGR